MVHTCVSAELDHVVLENGLQTGRHLVDSCRSMQSVYAYIVWCIRYEHICVYIVYTRI